MLQPPHTLTLGLLWACTISIGSASDDCLSQVSVADISSYQANITWTYDCAQSQLQGFKIYYDHVEYRACSSRMNKDKSKQVGEKSERNIGPHERFKVVGRPEEGKGLRPYSEYKFTVLAVKKSEFGHGGEKSVGGRTEQSLPRLVLRPGKISTAPDMVRYRLESGWRDKYCDQLNTDPGNILYEVRGLSPWNLDFLSEGEVSLDSKDIRVTGLQPFSEYKVKLYVTDRAGKFDSLEEEGWSTVTTSAGEPRPPNSLAILNGESVVWSDPYPPTEEISTYQFSWRDEDGVWTESDSLPVTRTRLLETGQRSVRLQDLDIPERTALRLRTFNSGRGGGSVWSSPVSETDGEMTTIVVVVVVVVIITVLVTVVFLVIRKCNLIQKYKGFERTKTYDSSRPILREPRNPTKIEITRPASTNSHSNGNNSPVVLRPSPRSSLGRNSKSRSVQDPLPPVPGEPFYEELKRPGPVEDEDGYMVPKMASMESLDDEGYLKPNFNRFQPLDTRTESRESPPPIPMVSYSSQDELERSNTDC